MPLFFEVNNPGAGNCAFNAFSIALIDLIKHESSKGNSPTFDKWCQLDPSLLASTKKIINFSYQKQDRELLQTLQMSLRRIVFNDRCDALLVVQHDDTQLLSNTTYMKFAEMVTAYINGKKPNANYNELARSPELLALAKTTADGPLNNWANDRNKLAVKNGIIDQTTLQAFRQDVYANGRINNDSLIVKSLAKIKQNFYWGSHPELTQLAQIFQVNLHTINNGNSNFINFFLKIISKKDYISYTPQDVANQPVVTMNNQFNRHWTTYIATSNADETSSTNKYQTYSKDSVLMKEEIQKIFENYTSGFRARVGCKRNHIDKAKAIIASCKDSSKTLDDVIGLINQYKTPAGSFARRVEYVQKRYEYYNGIEHGMISTQRNII